MTLSLIDGDLLVYRLGYACENLDGAVPEGIAKWRMDEFLLDLLQFKLDGVDDYEGYITGSNNFREKVAFTAPYKGNRTGKKPVHYDFLRNHLTTEWEFDKVEGIEADDAIARMATKYRDTSIIVSIDKDFDQVPGWHYNFVKGEKYYVDDDQGFYNFCAQLLTGDRADNIVGLRGIGPVGAAKILGDAGSASVQFKRCAEEYRKAGDTELEHFRENCRLLWLLREDPGKEERIETYLKEWL